MCLIDKIMPACAADINGQQSHWITYTSTSILMSLKIHPSQIYISLTLCELYRCYLYDQGHVAQCALSSYRDVCVQILQVYSYGT